MEEAVSDRFDNQISFNGSPDRSVPRAREGFIVLDDILLPDTPESRETVRRWFLFTDLAPRFAMLADNYAHVRQVLTTDAEEHERLATEHDDWMQAHAEPETPTLAEMKDARERLRNRHRELAAQARFALSRLPNDRADSEPIPDQKPLSEFPDWMRSLESFRRDVRTVRGRRLHACRSAENMRGVIEAMPESAGKPELVNLTNLLLRMVILENDGGPLSPCKLNAF